MRVLEFRIKGLTRDDLKRRRKGPDSANIFTRVSSGMSTGARVFVWAAVAVAALYVLQWSYTPSVILSGQVFTGHNVIILKDISGSMAPYEERLERLTSQLKSEGISVDNPVETKGGGFSLADSDNSLKKLEPALKENPAADAIFVFSDFTIIDATWDESDAAGYQRLRELLREGPRRRLYLGTVDLPPPDELVRIARESGGGLIEVKETH